MRLRAASAADAEAVRALSASRPFAAGWSEEALASEASRPDSLFLVLEEDGLLGYALARLAGGDAHLLDIASARDGRGAGRALWEGLTAAARARGAARLTLEVSEANARARAFYEAAGARVVGRRKKFYHDGSDALLMDRDLR